MDLIKKSWFSLLEENSKLDNTKKFFQNEEKKQKKKIRSKKEKFKVKQIECIRDSLTHTFPFLRNFFYHFTVVLQKGVVKFSGHHGTCSETAIHTRFNRAEYSKKSHVTARKPFKPVLFSHILLARKSGKFLVIRLFEFFWKKLYKTQRQSNWRMSVFIEIA